MYTKSGETFTSLTKYGLPEGEYKFAVIAQTGGRWDVSDINNRAFTVSVK